MDTWIYATIALLMILAVAGLVGLFIKSRDQWNRSWIVLMGVTLLFWSGAIWFAPWGYTYWLLALIPLLVLTILLGANLAGRPLPPNFRGPTSAVGEPLYTQEEIRGRAGTKEALTIYFSILAGILMLMALMRFMFSMVPY